MDTGGDMVYNGARAAGKIELKPKTLMDELATSGKKYTPQDVIMVTKNSNGDLLWLEQGNDSAGLKHILDGHESDFKARNYASEDLPDLLKNILSSETGPDSVKNTKRGNEAIYTYAGVQYKIAYGTNGYIVSFYPYSE